MNRETRDWLRHTGGERKPDFEEVAVVALAILWLLIFLLSG